MPLFFSELTAHFYWCEFASHPDFGSRSIPSLHLLFEVVDLLSQHLSVLQQIVEVTPGLICADHHLNFI